jgi:hypothetical protein
MRAVLFVVLLPLAGSTQQPKFEVAAIKPVTLRSADPSRAGLHVEGARVDLGMMSLTTLILLAYKVEPFQITGPDFPPLTRFDIQAKMPAGATKAQVPEMLQALLAERFGPQAASQNSRPAGVRARDRQGRREAEGDGRRFRSPRFTVLGCGPRESHGHRRVSRRAAGGLRDDFRGQRAERV